VVILGNDRFAINRLAPHQPLCSSIPCRYFVDVRRQIRQPLQKGGLTHDCGVIDIEDERPVAVVTGATGGIGRWIALGLARAGHHVVLIGRDRARGEAAWAWIAQQAPQASMALLIADLSLLSATQGLASLILADYKKIHLLINNAGVFDAKPVSTSEGRDRVLATNLLSPFVLTRALLPVLRRGAPSRVVNVGSSTSDRASLDPDHLVLGNRWGMQRAYSQSKLALMMTTFALAKRLEGSGVTANVVHPGLVATRLVRTGGIIGLVWRALAPIALSEEEGADTVLYVSLAPELAAVSGAYFKARRAVPPNPKALDTTLVERVWLATERLVVI
jgi:NAD(P)-dependent dehydrogenase (short-subunit alcohol dehydrogenase family)